jgi:hypothetical protein
MPYDPNIPADHADLTGAMFRGQFTGLKDLIDAGRMVRLDHKARQESTASRVGLRVRKGRKARQDSKALTVRRARKVRRGR